jgi:hypothetical protein
VACSLDYHDVDGGDPEGLVDQQCPDAPDRDSYFFVPLTSDGCGISRLEFWSYTIGASPFPTPFTTVRVLIYPAVAGGAGPDIAAGAIWDSVEPIAGAGFSGAYANVILEVSIPLPAGKVYIGTTPIAEWLSALQCDRAFTVSDHPPACYWWNPSGLFGLGTDPIPVSDIVTDERTGGLIVS